MQPVQRPLAEQFAAIYAGERVGFSGQQITDYFIQYSPAVKPYEHYGRNLLKRDELFIQSLYQLIPKQQYYALNDLTWNVYPSKYPYPNKAITGTLREKLHNCVCPSPIGLSFSTVRETIFREDWVTCQGRIKISPASAITAARAMLETLCKTILNERGQTPDTSGDLNRLVKQTLDILGVKATNRQGEYMVISGLGTVVNGLGQLSNAAGDRHGLVSGQSIDDPQVAELCINAAGAIGLALIELHLFAKR